MNPVSYRALFDLSDKIAVVTGATGFLGRRFCAGLAEFGARVAVIDLDETATAGLAAELTAAYSVDCLGVACDVASPAAVATMVERVTQALAGVDILLNNAATRTGDLDGFFAPVEDYRLETWRETMAVNLDGMFLVAQAVGKQMAAQDRGGSIIQMASIYGIVGPDPRIYEGSLFRGRPINTPPVYSASKAAVIGLTRHLATCWADHGIRVNSLTPGGVERGENDEFKRRYSARVPLGRMARADEMVGAAIFLASDASSYMTGQNLIVDGGLSAW